jgi:hypothetical protein
MKVQQNEGKRRSGDKVTDSIPNSLLHQHGSDGLLVTNKAAVRILNHAKRPAHEPPVARLRADAAPG